MHINSYPIPSIFQENYEKLCPLNKFIDRIKNFNHYSQFCSTIPELKDILAHYNVELKNIGCALYEGYTYLGAHDDEVRRDFCNYLNLWLDDQKNKHITAKPDVMEEKWELIEILWNKLNDIFEPSHQCKRKVTEKNALEIKKRMDLMVYCVNRNYFKDLCETGINSETNVNKYCSLFNELTDTNYTKFSNENKCIDDTLDPDNYRYNVFEECDLNNMAVTFPKFNFKTNEFVYDDESRIQSEKCPSTSDLIVGDAGIDVGGADVDVDLPKVDVDLGVADDGPVIFDSDPNKIILAAHHASPVQSSIDNGTSKSIYYSGLSLSGVFFTSMVLYKYTTLGPLIRSLVSKKEKLRQTTNKHLAEQWLQRTSEYMDSNSESAHYNFPYQSMQN
ncbi:PIR protein [Plasmodium vivax]|nr:PIR protein [Plasmodium vivax]